MKYNEYNFKITPDLKKKLFSIFRIIKINKIFSNKNIQKEFKQNNRIELEHLFIQNSELIINGLVKTYFYYNNLKNKKIARRLINEKIHKRINNLFGKCSKSDIKILIFIYENFINKTNLIDIVKFLNKISYNFKLKGGGFFSANPDFPYTEPETFFEKIKTYAPILWYLENKWPWIEWLLLIIDIIMDIAGMIPMVGNIVDIVGIIMAILKKDWISAILGLVQAIPAVGIFAGPLGILQQITKGYNKYTEIKGYADTAKEMLTDEPEYY